VLIVVVYFVIDSVRKLLDTPSYAYIFFGGGGSVLPERLREDEVCYFRENIHFISPMETVFKLHR
jgi:hypothetical protein